MSVVVPQAIGISLRNKVAWTRVEIFFLNIALEDEEYIMVFQDEYRLLYFKGVTLDVVMGYGI